ncbi:MAG: hypothetical protein ACE5ID_02745, partial [Acidobacteriota bacterium]
MRGGRRNTSPESPGPVRCRRPLLAILLPAALLGLASPSPAAPGQDRGRPGTQDRPQGAGAPDQPFPRRDSGLSDPESRQEERARRLGEGRRGPNTDQPPSREEARHRAEVDRQISETIQRLMVLRMKNALRLSDKQEKTVVPLIKELTLLRREHAGRRLSGIRSLNAMAQDEGAEDELLRQRLAAFDREERDYQQRQQQL